jgi:SRSO17 transposase
MGKVDFCRIDTLLVYANLTQRLWTMVDGELFIARRWFFDEYRQLRERTGLPTDREFATKLDLGWRMIARCLASGIRFDVVVCDSLYGRDRQFRAERHAAGVTYAAQAPAAKTVRVGKARGKVCCHSSGARRARVSATFKRKAERVEQRDSERGVLRARFALFRARAASEGRTSTTAEWLVIRPRREPRQFSYTPLNAPVYAPLESIAELSSRRSFGELAFQDAKSELGWGEFAERKYLAWEHHLALTGAELWFVAQTKLEWERENGRDSELAHELKARLLPESLGAESPLRPKSASGYWRSLGSNQQTVWVLCYFLFKKGRSVGDTRSRE